MDHGDGLEWVGDPLELEGSQPLLRTLVSAGVQGARCLRESRLCQQAGKQDGGGKSG